MSLYLLTYDLKGEGGREPLFAELRTWKAHRALASAWLVSSPKTAKAICEHFQTFLGEDDRLWVSRVPAGNYWYRHARSGTNDYLGANPPG